MEHQLYHLIEHMGYFGIILALVGGIIGIPIPDEILLTFVGYFVSKGSLSYFLSWMCAFIGAAGGISLSYYLGHRFGLPLIHKYGARFHITEERILKTKRLFVKVGPALLLVAYFIPGIRHLAALVAALNDFPFKKFAIYAYTGAIIWTFTFITLGRRLGDNWEQVIFFISHYRFFFISVIFFAVIVSYLVLKRKHQLRSE